MYPTNFLDPMLKEHLEAFKRGLCFLRIEKISFKSPKWDTYILFAPYHLCKPPCSCLPEL